MLSLAPHSAAAFVAAAREAFLHVDTFAAARSTDRLLYLKKFSPVEAILPPNGEAVAAKTTSAVETT